MTLQEALTQSTSAERITGTRHVLIHDGIIDTYRSNGVKWNPSGRVAQLPEEDAQARDWYPIYEDEVEE